MSRVRQSSWRRIPGCKGAYKISRSGKVKSVTKTIVTKDGRTVTYYGKILKLTPSDNGYLTVKLYGKRKRTAAVHVLVATAFVPNPDNLPEVNHKDLDKTNNHYSNLEWTTKVNNIRHGRQLGAFAGRATSRKLVNRVKKLRGQGLLQWQIAKKVKLNQSTVCRMLKGRTWNE
jgi:hypothetical protein